MYILQLISNLVNMPGLRGGEVVISDPIYIAELQPYDQGKCACTFFKDSAMTFLSVEEAMQWIQDKYTAGLKIAGMFGVVKK